MVQVFSPFRLWFDFFVRTARTRNLLWSFFGFATSVQLLWPGKSHIFQVPITVPTPPPEPTPSEEPTPQTPQVEREALLYLESAMFKAESVRHKNQVNQDICEQDTEQPPGYSHCNFEPLTDRRRRLFPVREFLENQLGCVDQAQPAR